MVDIDWSNITRILNFSSSLLDQKKRKLTDKEIETIGKYIDNPIDCGIWKLNAQWTLDDNISSYIKNELEKFNSENKEIQLTIGKQKLDINKDKIQEIIKNIKNFSSINFQIKLFAYIHFLEKNKGNKAELLTSNTFSTDDIITFETLDIKKIKRKYRNAYNIFIESIYYEDLPPIGLNELFIFKKGNILIENMGNGEDSEPLSIIGLDLNSINYIKGFLDGLGLIDEYEVGKIYSPETDLFAPYISYLNEIEIIDYPYLQDKIDNCLSEFENENFSQCVSIMGIMVEEILTQVYETLLREECDDNLTLGELYNIIQRRTNKIISKKANPPSVNIDDLLKEVNQKIKNGASANNQKEVLELIRNSLIFIKEQDYSTQNAIKEIISPKMEPSIFPKKIRNNFNELLIYRNAISHKSKIYIYEFEAIRSVYCAITILKWWDLEKARINWNKSQKEIIQTMIINNNSQL